MFRNPLIDAAVVLIVLLLFFGPKRLPALGKSLGEGMREFKDSITGHSNDEDDEQPSLNEAAPAPTAEAPPATAAPSEPASSGGAAPESTPVASSEQRI